MSLSRVEGRIILKIPIIKKEINPRPIMKRRLLLNSISLCSNGRKKSINKNIPRLIPAISLSWYLISSGNVCCFSNWLYLRSKGPGKRSGCVLLSCKFTNNFSPKAGGRETEPVFPGFWNVILINPEKFIHLHLENHLQPQGWDRTGYSAVRLAHLLWEQGVVSSNLTTPT